MLICQKEILSSSLNIYFYAQNNRTYAHLLIIHQYFDKYTKFTFWPSEKKVYRKYHLTFHTEKYGNLPISKCAIKPLKQLQPNKG